MNQKFFGSKIAVFNIPKSPGLKILTILFKQKYKLITPFSLDPKQIQFLVDILFVSQLVQNFAGHFYIILKKLPADQQKY